MLRPKAHLVLLLRQGDGTGVTDQMDDIQPRIGVLGARHAIEQADGLRDDSPAARGMVEGGLSFSHLARGGTTDEEEDRRACSTARRIALVMGSYD